jgi:hypothetical protein
MCDLSRGCVVRIWMLFCWFVWRVCVNLFAYMPSRNMRDYNLNDTEISRSNESAAAVTSNHKSMIFGTLDQKTSVITDDTSSKHLVHIMVRDTFSFPKFYSHYVQYYNKLCVYMSV